MSTDFYRERITKSRKRRRCECSRAWIEIGEPHWYCSGVTDGAFFTGRIHAAVKPIYARLYAKTRDGGDDPLPWEDTLEAVLDFREYPEQQADRDTLAALPGVTEWFVERVAKMKEEAA